MKVKLKKIKGKRLSLTEEKNALDYLEQAYYYIRQTEKNIIAWKWVVISLFGALYGFAVCACKGTSPSNVTCKTKSGKMKLISFDDALKLCQRPDWMHMTVFSKHLVLTDQQKKSVERLKEGLRNNFEHYIPTGWSIEIHGMPQMAIDVLEVIRFLALDTGNYVHLATRQNTKIEYMVLQSKRILEKSQLYKD